MKTRSGIAAHTGADGTVALALCLLAASVFAEVPGSDAQLERLARAAHEKSEKQLNIAWKDAVNRLQALDRDAARTSPRATSTEKLREAQRKWIAFRAAECAVNEDLSGGTADHLAYLGCMDTMAKARTQELQGWATLP